MSLGIRLRRRIRTSSSGGNTFSWIVTTNAFETKRLNGSVSISSAHTIVRATTNTTSSYVSIFGPRSWFTESSMARGWKPKSVSSSSRVRPLGSTMSTHVTAYFSTSSRARPTVTSCSSRTSVGVYAITSTRGIAARCRRALFKTCGAAPTPESPEAERESPYRVPAFARPGGTLKVVHLRKAKALKGNRSRSYQFVTPDTVGAEQMIVTVVEVLQGGSTPPHRHGPEVEAAHVILEGRGAAASDPGQKAPRPAPSTLFPPPPQHRPPP